MRRFSGARGALAMTTAIVAILGVAGIAPAATKDDGTGPPVAGVGIGSTAALAQDNCDAATERTSFTTVGTGPLCVNPWPDGKDNGGATATGVTETSVKVIAVVPNAEQLASSGGAAAPTDQATGQAATTTEGVRDLVEVYAHAQETIAPYQTWGRTIDWEIVESTGSDETAQRADAVSIAEKEPFMVYDLTNGPTLDAALAADKIMVVGGATNEEAGKQRPYRWINGNDPDAAGYLSADFIGTSLADRKARYAGDALKSETRVFGVVHPDTYDIGPFQEIAKERGIDKVSAVSYDQADATKFGEAATPLVSRLKAEGVTSVVLLAAAPMITALMTAAQSQEYAPEWIGTGFAYQEFDGFGRGNPPEQQARYFGIGGLPPAIEGTRTITNTFAWYWGDHAGVNWSTAISAPGFVYGAIHYAGPNLTAANVEKGLFAVPAAGGRNSDSIFFQAGYGRTVGLPYDEYGSPGSDRNLIWWNGDITGGTQAVASIVGKGKNVYLNDGQRYNFGTFPKKEPTFFDMSVSVETLPVEATYNDGKAPVAVPCPGDCPANTTTSP